MYYVFLQEVVPKGRVRPTQLALLTCGLFLILLALYRAKKNPGYLRKSVSNDRSLNGSQIESLNRKGFPGADPSGSLNNRTSKDEPKGSWAPSGSPAKAREDWCAKCQLVRPARAWHCRICGICVRRMDHHCVWYVGRIWRLVECKFTWDSLAVFALPLYHPHIFLFPSFTPCGYLWAVMMFPLSHQFFEFHKFSSFQSFPEGFFVFCFFPLFLLGCPSSPF